MDLLSIIIIGTGLAMDCFAVSISRGMCIDRFDWSKALRMAFLFGLFQAIMPLIGYLAGFSLAGFVESFDHWIAFGLLGLIGGKMFVEGLKPIDPQCELNPNPFQWKTLFALAIATSIDALATGIIFITFPGKIYVAVAIIGIISFILSLFGTFVGTHFGKKLKFNVEILGGIILVGIGIKILIEHLFQHT
jgi:manganese efflux pump family protein